MHCIACIVSMDARWDVSRYLIAIASPVLDLDPKKLNRTWAAAFSVAFCTSRMSPFDMKICSLHLCTTMLIPTGFVSYYASQVSCVDRTLSQLNESDGVLRRTNQPKRLEKNGE